MKDRGALIAQGGSASQAMRVRQVHSPDQIEILLQGGQICVRNHARVDAVLIDRILSPIPRLPFRLAILLSKETPPHRLVGIEPPSGTLPRPCLVLQKDPGWYASRLPKRWDITIDIARRTCGLSKTFPVYFALTLLQEIAHARIAHRDLALHMVHCMLFDLMWNDALAAGRRILEYEIPGERQCARAALKQARRIFGSLAVDQEIARMSLEPRALFGSTGDVREYSDWVARIEPDAKDPNVYDETRLLGGAYAQRLLWAWEFERKEFRRILLQKDLVRLLGRGLPARRRIRTSW